MSIYRAIRWRIHKRLRRYVIADTGQETFVVNARDTFIGEGLFINGQHDFGKVEAVLRLLGRRPRLLIDVGANIGPICIPALARGYVESAIAIEPEPGNLRLLRANVAINGLHDRVTVHASAVGAIDEETLTLDLCEDNLGDHRIHAEGETGRSGVEVSSSTLDTLCPDARDPLIWIDTQGYEGFVLQGATRLLKDSPPVVAEFWPYGFKRSGSFKAFCSALAHYSEFIDLQTEARRPINELSALFREHDRPTGGTDILAV